MLLHVGNAFRNLGLSACLTLTGFGSFAVAQNVTSSIPAEQENLQLPCDDGSIRACYYKQVRSSDSCRVVVQASIRESENSQPVLVEQKDFECGSSPEYGKATDWCLQYYKSEKKANSGWNMSIEMNAGEPDKSKFTSASGQTCKTARSWDWKQAS